RETNLGSARFEGTLASAGYGHRVLSVETDAGITETAEPLCGEPPFALDAVATIPVELVEHRVRAFVEVGSTRVQVASVEDLVAGDVLVVQGQSNAVAQMYDGSASANESEFIRSVGSPENPGGRTWAKAVGDTVTDDGFIGQWPLRMARTLVDTHRVPLAVFNGGKSGQPIAYFQRDDTTPTANNNYGQLLSRLRDLGLTDSVRAILWYQGESDASDNALVHVAGFVALRDDWHSDYPNLERIYVTQIRNGCVLFALEIREAQRRFPDLYEDIRVMSTTNLPGHQGAFCHYAFKNGYETLGQRYAAMLGRDLYGAPAEPWIDPPNPASIEFTNGTGTELTIHMRSTGAEMRVGSQEAKSQFALVGSAAVITGISVGKGAVRLTLDRDGRSATGLTFASADGAVPTVYNERGVGMLAFVDVPITK
ncbi:MAG: hypothetical protein KC417_05985, partial [Myxococcales bacterium]|nr:hypothetical protein [Myxococcales bacterium]